MFLFLVTDDSILLVGSIPQEPIFFRFRIDPEMRRFLDRLRDEKDINVSAWVRRQLSAGFEREFPGAVTTAAPEPDPDPTPPVKTTEPPAPTETPADKEPDPDPTPPVKTTEPPAPIETPADQEPDPQKPPVETGGAPEPDPKKALITGWRPRPLDNGKWGAVLEGPRVAELPKNDQLPGTLIRVTDKKGESWTTTLTEVIDRTDTTIVVANSGRPRS